MLSLRGVLGELGSNRSVCGGVKVNAPQRIIYLYTHIRLLSHIIYQTERIYQKMVWGWEGTTTSHEDNGKLVRKPPRRSTFTLYIRRCWLIVNEILLPIVKGKGFPNYTGTCMVVRVGTSDWTTVNGWMRSSSEVSGWYSRTQQSVYNFTSFSVTVRVQ